MTKQGRPSSTEPATAYDYRRYIALVQVLAIDDPAKQEGAILELCRVWEVAPVRFNKGTWVNMMATVEKLAKSAIEYHRKEGQA